MKIEQLEHYLKHTDNMTAICTLGVVMAGLGVLCAFCLGVTKSLSPNIVIPILAALGFLGGTLSQQIQENEKIIRFIETMIHRDNRKTPEKE